MTEPGVFLIHGLGGTQYDLGSMHKRLKNAGFATHSLTLPRSRHQARRPVGRACRRRWIKAVRSKYLEVLEQHEVLHVMGICAGRATGGRDRQARTPCQGATGGTGAAHLHRWLGDALVPGFRPLLYRVPGLPRRMKVAEEDPCGIKNEQLREIVKAKFERGENFHYNWCRLPASARSIACEAW